VSAPPQRSLGFGAKARRITREEADSMGARLETVRQRHKEGLSLRAIAAKVHASAMTIQRILQREQSA
jgi:Trp operon repressor